MLYTGGPLTVLVKGGVSEGEVESAGDTAIVQLTFILIYVITFFLLAIRWKKTVYVLTKNQNIVLLTGIAAFSLLWSVDPTITFTRIVALIGTTLFGVYLSVSYNSLEKHLLIVSFTFGLIVIVSLIFSVVLPKYGVMSGIHAGSWRGIYVHKNAFGKWMVLSAIICLLKCLKVDKKYFIWEAALGLSIFMLVLSRSSAAIIVFLDMIIIFSLLNVLRLQYDLIVPIIAFMMLVTSITTLWAVDNANEILGVFGKDTTFTGRTDLWELLIDMALRRPWLGYGYGAFWGLNSASEEVWRAIPWHPPNAHNGYIDILLNIGFIGLFIFAIGFIRNLAISLMLVRQYKTPEVLFPCMLISYFAISNFSESGLMVQNDFGWVIYVSLSYLLSASLNNKNHKSLTINHY
ncbi:O-antigen ligase family protein [Halotia branconii]|uniref:O-antigen ligase n=1 Tax=Halotia branconii CENA392 TaxID=1539056 RepID=A0AAJ6NWA3_9CYAN|nr:O-antigen ligase [Halotia branconii]WGV27782.1 O-antigen ligase [Halotia branconii CENA392]